MSENNDLQQRLDELAQERDYMAQQIHDLRSAAHLQGVRSHAIGVRLSACRSFLTRFKPRIKSRPIFVGTYGFSDNIKYAYLFYLHRYGPDSASYLTYDPMQHKALKEHGFNSILWQGLESGDAINAVLSASAIVTGSALLPHTGYGAEFSAFASGKAWINVWHGVPIKKIGRHYRVHDKVIQTNLLIDSFRPWHFLVPSKSTLPPFEDSYLNANFLIARYPRNLSWYYPDLRGVEINTDLTAMAQLRLDKADGHLCLVFTPTFRDNQTNLVEHYKLDHLNEALGRANIKLYVKFHHLDMASVFSPKTKLSHIRSIGSYTDIYPLLPKFDALITDVSSILYDYALLNKPIFLSTPNDTESIQSLRGADTTKTLARGLVNYPALSELIDHLHQNCDKTMSEALEKTRAVRNRVYDHSSLKTKDRVSPWIYNIARKAGSW